jgi:hypothetical protein
VLRRLLIPAFLLVVVGLAIGREVVRTSSASADDAPASAGTAVAQAASSGSLTAKAVSAANAFLGTLSSSQRSTATYAFNSSAKTKGCSNLPTAIVARNGVKIADLSSAQVAKLRTLLKTILSSQGYADEEATRKADTYLNQQQASGQGGAQNLQYGEGLYYVAFFGTPSTSRKWTVQFGGHHLAIHMTFSGTTVSNTPYFVGVEPSATFTVDGKSYSPMADEAAALFGAAQSLTSSQRTKAKLSQTFDDVLVGPGKDGQFPAKQGITVSSLSKAQRAKVTKAIEAYVGDMPTAQAKARLALYEKQYSQTRLAWSKSTDPTVQGAYVRLHGPRLWIEIVVQNGVVLSGVHYPSIERDIKTDYGAGT